MEPAGLKVVALVLLCAVVSGLCGFGGALLAIVGLPIIGSFIGLLMVMIGCFMITSVDMPAKMQADEIKKALKDDYEIPGAYLEEAESGVVK